MQEKKTEKMHFSHIYYQKESQEFEGVDALCLSSQKKKRKKKY